MPMPRLEPGQTTYREIEGEPHREVIEKLVAAGFDLNYDQKYDDGGKPIEGIATITCSSAQALANAVRILNAEGYGATPKGEATSANSSMKDGGTSDLAHLKGRFILALGSGPVENLTLPDSRFEKHEVASGKAHIMRARVRGVAHRLLADAGSLTPLELDRELGSILGKGHGTGLTHTTRNSTRLAGPIATGAQGPERFDASLNVKRLTIINGSGDVQVLSGDEAAVHVGLNGAAGLIKEADLEVQHELPHEFGIFIPLPGSLRDGMVKHIPAIVSRLAQYTLSHLEPTEDGAPIIASKNGPLLLKGFEIVTLQGMDKGYNLMNSGPAKGKAGVMLQNMRENQCEVGLMINGRSKLKPDQIDTLFTGFFDETDAQDRITRRRSKEGVVGTLNTLMDDDNIHADPTTSTVFSDRVMSEFREIRELVAIAARKSKEVGPSKSTDFNIKIDPSQSIEDILKAIQLIMEIGCDYISEGLARGAEGYVYGHTFIGALINRILEILEAIFSRKGGGIDLHLRLTFPTQTAAIPPKDERPRVPPQSLDKQQARAAENVDWLEGRLTEYTLKLLSLHGTLGMTVEPGEKGLASSPEYVRWLEENDQAQAKAIWQTIKTEGGKVFGSRTGNIKFHAYPPRIEEGALNYFAAEDIPGSPLDRRRKSIALWAQNSHRSADGQLVYGEMLGLIRDWLELDFDDRVFIASSREKSIYNCHLALTDYKGGKITVDLVKKKAYGLVKRRVHDEDSGEMRTIEFIDEVSIPEDFSGKVDTVIVNGPEQADDPRLKGIRKILAIEDKEKVSQEDYRKFDAVVYGAEAFGAGGQMGIEVMPLSTIQRERELIALGNQTGYVHSPNAKNDLPHSMIETPPLETIADMTVLLALELNQKAIEDVASAAQRLNIQKQFITVTPGPAQNHPASWERAVEFAHTEQQLLKDPEALRAKVEEVRSLLRIYLKIPDTHEIFFAGSATEAMEITYNSMQLDRAVALTAGPFGNRQLKVAQRAKPPKGSVMPVFKRWGTSVNGDDSIVSELKTKLTSTGQQLRMALCTTGNETGCGVWNDTDQLARDVNCGVYSIVDGTSELLGVGHDWGIHDVYFGSGQKVGGVISGLSMLFVRRKTIEDSREALERRAAKANLAPLFRTFPEMSEDPLNAVHNVRGMLQLECVLKDFINRGGLPAIRSEMDCKMQMLDEMIAANPHMDQAVVSKIGRSPTVRHIVCIDRAADDIELKMRPVAIAGGYGPYKGDTLRVLASPHIPNNVFATEVVDRLDRVSRIALPVSRERPVTARFVGDLKLCT